MSQFSYQLREITWFPTKDYFSVLKILLFPDFSLRFWPDYGLRRQIDKTPEGNGPLLVSKAVMITWLGFLKKGTQKVPEIWKLDRRDSWFKEQPWHNF